MSIRSGESDRNNAGVLLVGHGTRQATGVAEFERLAAMVGRQLAPTPVASGFLEFAEPSIADAVTALAEKRINRIAVVPVLLFAAGHAKHDIPAAVAAAARQHPGMHTFDAKPIGCDDVVLDLSARCYLESLAPLPSVPAHETLLIMVGRGSKDPEAIGEMHRFAQLRCERTPVGDLSVCFLAMAEPPLDDALKRAAASAWTRVFVQPHLLFAGELVDRVRDRVETCATANPNISWVSVRPLGATEELAGLLAANALAALARS